MKNARILTVAGADALAELDRLRAEFPRTGEYPILLGDSEEVEGIEENQEDELDADPEGAITLDKSEGIDAAAWLRRARHRDDEFEVDADGESVVGEWPGDVLSEPIELTVHRDVLTGKLKPRVAIGLFAVAAAWEVFPKLGWGNWNECPEAAVHAAVHRYWGERYGAEVVAITQDVVQCIVARPPVEPAACMLLAREQYAYCEDIVEQGVGSIANLAATLQNSPYWYFWWD